MVPEYRLALLVGNWIWGQVFTQDPRADVFQCFSHLASPRFVSVYGTIKSDATFFVFPLLLSRSSPQAGPRKKKKWVGPAHKRSPDLRQFGQYESISNHVSRIYENKRR